MSQLHQFKELCIGCGSRTKRKNKEHPFPRWLITRTGTDKTSIRWVGNKRIPAHKATLPICEQCNHAFGKRLEEPMRRILDAIERGEGVSDNEAEIMVRWLWKVNGILWHVEYPANDYSAVYSLRDRVLNPLNDIRGHLVVAIALCEQIDPTYGDAPMGIDSKSSDVDGIFVSGVFCRTAMMVVLDLFAHLIPDGFSKYQLAPTRGEPTADAKLFYPRATFPNDTELVYTTAQYSSRLTAAHEEFARAHLKAAARDSRK